MNAVAGSALPLTPTQPAADCAATIAALRQAGAERFDPVRWHYIEALARRAAQQPERVKRILEDKLAVALADLKSGIERAQHDARATIARSTAPQAGATLAELLRHIAQHAPPAAASTHGGARPELKAARYFSNTWSKLSVDRQVSSAIDQAPKNAGPLNSHFLVLRSLEIMRDISPDYLNRFTCYVDSLLCLDQAASLNKPASKPAEASAS